VHKFKHSLLILPFSCRKVSGLNGAEQSRHKPCRELSASEITCIVSSGALNSTHSLYEKQASPAKGSTSAGRSLLLLICRCRRPLPQFSLSSELTLYVYDLAEGFERINKSRPPLSFLRVYMLFSHVT